MSPKGKEMINNLERLKARNNQLLAKAKTRRADSSPSPPNSPSTGPSNSGGGGHDGDGKQLYVGNLSFDTQWYALKDHFKCCGDVDRAEVIEGQDGRPKGFGTVRFFNARDAEKAIDEMDGTMLDGRKIYVRLDRQA